MCDEDYSQRIADVVRAKFPDSLPVGEKLRSRNAYISKHMFELYDQDKDGRISPSEYLDGEWATYLVQLPASRCRFTRQDFMTMYLPDAYDSASGPHVSKFYAPIAMLYDQIDVGKKGYIIKSDIEAQSIARFRSADREHKGYLVSKDLSSR